MRFDYVVRSLVRSSLAPSASLQRKSCVFSAANMSTNFSYEEAVKKLNSLQSNKSTLDQIRKNNKSGVNSQATRKTLKPIQKCSNLEDMKNYLSRIGITLTTLDELSVIHVAGTKGKGSTCAMCESILRAHGFRTGLFTSPHLVAVRERIKLDGQLISREQFARYFHHVFDMLRDTQAYEGDMPKYFAFQTVLAFNIFLKEKVDVAIIEVGIGGAVDYTNVLRKVPVVGITALGLDHTSILGDTIDKIAEAKAGIMKQGCEAYTVRQPAGGMPVLRRVASDTQCTLNIVPDYSSYTFPKDKNKILSVDVDAYKMNASLAIQLAHAWMRLSKLQIMNQRSLRKLSVSGKIAQNNFIDIDPVYKETDKRIDEMITTVPKETVNGLRDFHWPGRYQTIRADYATFCLDGAHTKESMEICAKWFLDNNRTEEKILIFSATGDRDVENLLKPLLDVKFKTIYFVTPTAFKTVSPKSDNYSILAEEEDLLKRCHKHLNIWKDIESNSSSACFIFECVSDAFIDIKRNSNEEMNHSSVLITGSLHLVGAALSILDPNLSKD